MSNVAAPIGGTEANVLVTVVVNGQSLGIWDSMTGGDTSAAVPQHRSGGQKNRQSYRALANSSEITVSRVCNLAVDWELIRTLESLVGGTPGSVTEQPLDGDLNPYGNSRTAVGMFSSVSNPRVDSNSDALQTYELKMTVDLWQ